MTFSRTVLSRFFALVLSASIPSTPLLAAAGPAQPTGLAANSRTTPLGLDDSEPQLSWQLQDPRFGARQTAYEIRVYSKAPSGRSTKPDIWDSGRIASSTSTGIPYAGPKMQPETRYFWQVMVWDQDGQPYPVSSASWWETGLLDQANWHANWIGYEPAELHSVRESGAAWITNIASTKSEAADTHEDFRYAFTLSKPVAHATLYATGEDTAAAWVNGKQVLEAQLLPAYQQMPWATYSHVDVTRNLQRGANLLAIGITRYKTAGAKEVPTKSPMSAVLYVRFEDGSTRLLTTAASGWKAKLDASGNWWEFSAPDFGWSAAQLYQSPSDPEGSQDLGSPWPTGPVASLRKSFSTKPRSIASARLYATALGAYKFYCNGKSVGREVLSPGWMDFREHVPYQVYDVSAQIHPGKNALGALLGPGWYSTPLMWMQRGNNYGVTQPSLKAQLRIEYSDGSVDWIATDGSWKADVSSILSSEIYNGETRDARREQKGWDTALFSDSFWHPAMVVPAKEPQIIAQYFQPIREHEVMTAKSVTEPKPGVYVIDFGQNMSAVPRLHIKGSTGENIRLRFSEVLNPDGTLYTDNLRTAKATDHFILAGTGGYEEFQPLFTFHGFRYAEITGVDSKPMLETLKAVVLHTDAPFTSHFATDDDMLNKLWDLVLWGQRSNFIGVPTDCPQRDERLGWSADAQVFWRTATFNMDLTTFSQKYAADLHGTQLTTPMYGIFAPGVTQPNPGYGAAWSDAGVIIPWTGWIQSGDTHIIEQNWDGMERYLANIASKNPNHLWQNGFGTPFGDWLTPTITTPEDLLATAYWAYDASLMHQMALATHRTNDAAKYQQMFDAIKAAFQKAYIQQDGFVGTIDHYPSIPPTTVHPLDEVVTNKAVETQTGYVLALHMHLVPENLRQAVAQKLVNKIRENHWMLGTGFVGTPYLLEALSDTGHADVAYRLLLNRAYPSWGYLIDHGATTTWERWNGDKMRNDPSMNSYNHYAYGAVAEWLYRYAAGVDTDSADAGFHTIRLHPNFDARLGRLDFTYDSRFGPIHSSWAVEDNMVKWLVVVPPNTTAILSTENTNATNFERDSSALAAGSQGVSTGEQAGTFVLAAGSYKFTATLKPTSPETADATH